MPSSQDMGGGDDLGPGDLGRPDMSAPPVRVPTQAATGGGGALRSPAYRARVMFGSPMPADTLKSPNYHIKLGPGPAQHGQGQGQGR